MAVLDALHTCVHPFMIKVAFQNEKQNSHQNEFPKDFQKKSIPKEVAVRNTGDLTHGNSPSQGFLIAAHGSQKDSYGCE